MGFIMDGLDAESYDRQYPDQVLIRRIWGYFRPQGQRMLTVAFAITLQAGLETFIRVFISGSLDRLQATPEAFSITRVIITLIALECVSWVITAIRQWFSSRAVGEVVLKLREDAFDAVLRRDLAFFDKYPTGKIVSRVSSDTAAFTETVNLTTNLISQFLLLAVMVSYLFWINATLTWITLTIAPVIIFIALSFRHIARATVTASRRIMATVTAHVQETIGGIAVAKSFRQEQAIYEEFVEVNNKAYQVNLRTGFTFAAVFPLLSAVAGVGLAVVIYSGVQIGRAEASPLTAGEFYLFIQGLQVIWFPLTSIASFWSQFQLGLAAGERLFGLIDAAPDVIQSGKNLPVEGVKGEIRFEQMEFAYNADEPVLKDFSLTIRAGESVALVGHTGSGKSSIAKLVGRFYEYQGGKLLIDGTDIRDLDIEAYRRRIGFVTQTPFLFDGTILENIRYGQQRFNDDGQDVGRISDEAVIAAAHKVAGGDWIDSFPEGLNTQVGERGGNLSIGQRQLVALARIMLEDPAIFILDEATASIDPLTEALIQEGLDEAMQGRTSIVIAHRLSTVRAADRIIVLKQGEILEEGSHDALIAAGGHYAELYNTYFRHQSLSYIENLATKIDTGEMVGAMD
ncbi:MAG: ABC transporter ATP-binding protein [Phototrophicaceae bacterium]|jgi:ABC-type multidrug transport system fused ATPase/permease subunit